MKIENGTLTMRLWDDWHFHPRQEKMLERMIPFANQFGRVEVMPNLIKPVDEAQRLNNYRDEIMSYQPKFEPVMSVLLTKRMTPWMLRATHKAGAIVLKILSGGTTNSDEAVGLEQIDDYYDVLAEAEALGMLVSIHVERSYYGKTKNLIPEMEREFMALSDLEKIMIRFPRLRIIFEHMSDRRSVKFFLKARYPNLFVTLTVQHLHKTIHDARKSLNEIKDPYLICKPCLKLLIDLHALQCLALSGDPNVFFGSDRAAHPRKDKLRDNPKSGVFVSHPIEILAKFYETNNRLDLLEPLGSQNGARCYSYPLNKREITLVREKQIIPAFYGESRSHPDALIPFMAGETIDWKIINDQPE